MMLGALTHSAQRHPAGSVPDMTALVEAGTSRRAPQGRNSLPPLRLLIEHLRSTDDHIRLTAVTAIANEPAGFRTMTAIL
jgi:hypothetical protein